jgi:hypothetical protein
MAQWEPWSTCVANNNNNNGNNNNNNNNNNKNKNNNNGNGNGCGDGDGCGNGNTNTGNNNNNNNGNGVGCGGGEADGMRRRYRGIAAAPANGGALCGAYEEIQQCTPPVRMRAFCVVDVAVVWCCYCYPLIYTHTHTRTQACEINCEMAAWQPWDECSIVCARNHFFTLHSQTHTHKQAG